MGWFTKKSKEHSGKKQQDEIWIRCQSCSAHIFKQDFLNNISVCPKCGWHGKLTAYERIGITLDSGTFKEMFESIRPGDPLHFVDGKGPYIEKILQAANYACDRRVPYIIFSASGGARMHEGILSLMQMAKTCAGVARLDERRIPFISVLTDPTTGGVSASYAMVGDVNIAEPGALIGFAGRRVIEQTIKQKLPEDFQTAEFVLEHGFLDAIVHRREMKNTLHRILSYYNR
jgi:acetyl-CoA carboxylase carboxyl transferase subunit beta